MPVTWRQMPPLAALRAFEATARLKSFSAAARELNVTHAAVAQQVRALEAELGLQLVRRAGRTVSLTEAGQRLAQTLGEGFGTITRGIEDLQRSEGRRPLRVATTTFIAEAHIMPRLPEFWALHPGIEVAMSPSPTLVDFARDGFDLAVRSFPNVASSTDTTEVILLAQTPILAVCAPDLLREGPTNPQDLPWINVPEDDWDREQLRNAGLSPERIKKVKLGSPHLEMSAARQGLGVMFATEIISRADLEAGRLVILPLKGLSMVTYAVVLPKVPRRPAVDQFVAWLRTIF